MIQDLMSQSSDSDSGSGGEMSKSWEALHSVNTRHHLHQHPVIAQDKVVNETQGQAIRDDDAEITASQRNDNGNPNDDEIETRDTGNLNDDARETRNSVNDVLSETDNADNLERTEQCNLEDNEKEVESRGVNKSPYALRTRK